MATSDHLNGRTDEDVLMAHRIAISDLLPLLQHDIASGEHRVDCDINAVETRRLRSIWRVIKWEALIHNDERQNTQPLIDLIA